MTQNLLSMGFLVAGLLYFYVGFRTYYDNRQNRPRQLFLVLCLIYCGWAVVTALMNDAEDIERAVMYRNLGMWFVSFSYPVLIHFILAFVGQEERLARHKRLYGIIYTPAIVNVITYCFFFPYTEASMRKISAGWTYNQVKLDNAFADKYLAIYVGLSFAAAILIVGISAFRKTAMRRERTSLKILLFGILFLCISGGMTDLVLPMMGKASLPPLGMIINVILILFFSYLMKRFSFVSFNIDNMVTTILMGIDDGVILVDNQFNIIYTNDGFAGIVGVDSHASLMGENIKNILPISGEDSIEKNMVKEEFLIERQGKRQYLLSTFSGYYDPYGDFLAGAFTLKDITELREKQNQLEYINRNLEKIIKERTEELQYLAYHDPLTKMLNRRAVIEQIEAALSEKGKEMRHAFVFIDLNKFKEINDTFGHDVGDKVLIETADRLNTVFGDRAILSRMGGDEFLIFMKNVQDEELEQYMAELEVEFGAPLVISETAHYIRISCGISRYPVDGDTVDQLIFKADMEMYEAKRASRGEVCKDNGLLS